MRPVDRGSIPLDDSGQPKEFSKYKYAKQDLLNRIGNYCSYCEVRVNVCPAVEHIMPKVHNPDLELQWSNFLVACTNCNSIKGINPKDGNLDDYYWPDKDNTVRAIEYREGGTVRVNPSLSPEQRTKAEATIGLTGLDRKPVVEDPAASDQRWKHRYDVWGIAEDFLQELQTEDRPALRRAIIGLAQANGFWSVWMTVFRDYPDMRRRFIGAFPGTSQECFDDDCNAIPRPGGAI